ncbi:hypothetical protein K523DRAFT_359261, partial [Schizophyllum commune Tattone D]
LERICHRYHFQIPPSTPLFGEVHAPLPRWTPDVEYDPFEGCNGYDEWAARKQKLIDDNRRIARWFAYRARVPYNSLELHEQKKNWLQALCVEKGYVADLNGSQITSGFTSQKGAGRTFERRNKMPSRVIPREEKKSFKGWAKGVRQDLVLEPMWSLYCDAAQRGTAQRRRVLELIYDRFHFQIPPDVPAKAEFFGPLPPWTPETMYDPFEDLKTEEEKQARRSAY